MASLLDVAKDFFCGCLSGWGQVLTMMPFEHVKVKVVSHPQKYTGYLQCIRLTLREEGPSAFYRGMLMPLIGVGGQVAATFAVVETLKKALQQHYADEQGMLPSSLSFACGLSAGLPSALVMTPIDHARFRVTITPGYTHGSLAMIKQLFREHGVRKAYLGFSCFALREAIGNAFYFGSYDTLIRRFRREGQGVPVVGALLSGGVAGLMCWLSIYPIDYVKTRVQTDDLLRPKFSSSTDCFRQIYRAHGWPIFFTGFGIMMARAFPVNAVGFLCFEIGKSIVYSAGPAKQ